MSVKKIQVDVVSAEGPIFSGEAVSISVRGGEGELGISYGHTQLLTSIPPGSMRIHLDNGKEELLFVAGGILEVQPGQVITLADVVERPQDINEAAAKEAKQRAEELLKDHSKDKVNLIQAQQQLIEADARLRVLSLMKGISKNH
ncbi:F0F1 ATP synthase subunit epsilon [Francisellaceae bacterium]|nr:F0F1 ATP synthase subunit epsilon [Francisellaceae bacterium]